MRKVSGTTGNYIPCCWSDCGRHGDTRYEHIEREGINTMHWLFCSERHKALWLFSPKRNNQLPTGSRGMIT